MPETTPTPPKFTIATIITLVAIVAQGLMTVELFAAHTVPGKILQVVAMVLTALGAPLVARAGSKVIPTALLVLLVATVVSSGCAGTGERLGRVAAGTIDCLTPEASDAITTFGPALGNVVRNATSPDGRVDWTPIKDVGRSMKTPVAQCVLASVIAEALHPPKPRPDAPMSSALQWDPVSLSSGWEEMRGEWGGAKYQLASGTL